MTIEQAGKVTNRDGLSYLEIPSERLSHMSRSINKAIINNGHDTEKLDQLQIKAAAIKTILKARNEGSVKEP
jgi:hypothetical protein